ncbi:MAG: hypothetical protein ACI9LO_003313 [Planctomycetota bacterium]
MIIGSHRETGVLVGSRAGQEWHRFLKHWGFNPVHTGNCQQKVDQQFARANRIGHLLSSRTNLPHPGVDRHIHTFCRTGLRGLYMDDSFRVFPHRFSAVLDDTESWNQDEILDEGMLVILTMPGIWHIYVPGAETQLAILNKIDVRVMTECPQHPQTSYFVQSAGVTF